jgi:hypothetical protein
MSIAPRAAVRIDDAEVIFTIDAPGAKSVFLVGDFNNWNPTLEQMYSVDGKFEVSLYLLPGIYRYKFVVDGTWVVDPENTPADPAKGSVLALEERGGMLAFGSTEEVEKETVEVLQPSLRYTGAFELDDGDTSSDQRIDFIFKNSRMRFVAALFFKKKNDSWSLSPLEARIDLDRGYIDLHFGDKVVKGFENDTTWTSRDPFHLFGKVGVFDYNAGYERHGASAVLPLPLNIELGALYTDKIDDRPAQPLAIDSTAFDGFSGAGSPDTTVYRYKNTFGGSDTWGIQLFADAGSFKLGYVKRGNKGFQPGTLAVIEQEDSGYVATAYTTREFWDADVVWLRWRFLSHLAAVAGLGRATGDVRTDAVSTYPTSRMTDVSVGQITEPSDKKIPIQKSKRWHGALEYEKSRWTARARYSWNRYEFEPGLYASSVATIQGVDVDGEYRADKWRAAAKLSYLDQDYGVTPDDFHFFTPARNFWLDYRDKLTIENMVVFDTPRSTQLTGTFIWNKRVLSRLSRIPDAAPTTVFASGALVMREFFGSVEYADFRAAVDRRIYKYLYGQVDTRIAFYDKSSWELKKTFFSIYVEAGYRRDWVEASVGFGFDPVVLDPVINEYSDIGRLEHLRQAIPMEVERGDASVLGEGIRRQEDSLAKDRVLKLEVILFF